MKTGRPIEWTEEKKKKAVEIILYEMMENGKSIRAILTNADRDVLPSHVTFINWLSKDDELVKQYARANEIRSDILFDEMFNIADNSAYDTIETEKGEVCNHEYINRSRLRIDTRKWALSKMNPKKYGEQIDITTKGDKIGQYSDWTPEQIKAELKRLNG